MKFVMPIKGKSADELYKLNRDGHGGFYPIGLNNAYHGGMHFEGEHLPVVAIADGTIIAYRYCKKHLEETSGGQTYKYSSCFVLVKHEYTTPKGQKLTFYSHYNNLQPWDELKTWIGDETEKLPKIVTKPGYTIRQEGLSLRSSPRVVNNPHSNRIGSLSRGTLVIAAPVAAHPGWAKKEGVEEYFCYQHNRSRYAVPCQVASDPEFDKVVSCNIPIKAGDLVGYSGIYESIALPHGYTITHIEVFAGDDIEDFVKNTKGDGEPTQIKIAQPKREIYKRDKVYPDISHIESIIRHSGTMVEITAVSESQSNHNWVKAKDKKCTAVVPHSWLEYSHGHYTAKTAHLTHVKNEFNKFEGVNITATTTFELIAKKPHNHRMISVDFPNPKEYWIQRTKIGEYDILIDEPSHCYKNDPEAAVYTSIETLPYDCAVPSKEIAHDGSTIWHHVAAGEITGWVKDADVTKCSPFDWLSCGFSLIKEEDKSTPTWKDEKSGDGRIDIDKTPEPFKSIFNAIDTSKDGKLDEHELVAGIRVPANSYKLSRLICRHQTEWYYDDNVPLYKEAIENAKNTLGQEGADNLKTRIKQLCWWSEVPGLPSKTVWHVNPVAFVEQMESMRDLITIEMLRVSGATGSDERLNDILVYLNMFAKAYGVTSPLAIVHFLAQCGAENNFKIQSENTNYSEAQALKYFGKKIVVNHHEVYKYSKLFDPATKNNYIHHPTPFANYVYANRMGNGPESSGDGWNYRGKGLIQITGRTNYKHFTINHNQRYPDDHQDFELHPDLIVNELKYGIESAFAWWFDNNVNHICTGREYDDVKRVTLRVNGGLNGFDTRLSNFYKLLDHMGL